MPAVARGSSHLTSGGAECYLIISAFDAPPPAAPTVRVGAGAATVEGWIVCGADAKAAMEDRRLHQIGIMDWDGSRLLVGHPSGPGRSPMPDSLNPELRREAQQTLGILGGANDGTSAALLAALDKANPFFLFVMIPLDPS